MTSIAESEKLLRVNLDLEDQEADEAGRMIKDHYESLKAVAVVTLDKDETTQDPNAAEPSDPRLVDVIAQAQDRGIIVSFNSNSSRTDLKDKLGMTGLPIAELGGLIAFPDGSEIHLVQSGEWFTHMLLGRFIEAIRADRKLRNNTAIFAGDPWSVIWVDTRFPGSQGQLVMLNDGRHVSASFLTALLDQSQGGRMIRGVEESRAFFEQMKDIFMRERDHLVETHPFPDPEGMKDHISCGYEVVFITSRAASKQRAMGYMARVLQMPVFHIGDRADDDDMSGVFGVTSMAVGNGSLRDIPGIIAAQSEMATGVIELFEDHILPQFPQERFI